MSEPTLRRACVTGGSRGIGRAVAAALTEMGCAVTILGRSEESLAAVVEAGEAAASTVVDVTAFEALRAVIAAGEFDILVNNAGGAETGAFLKSGLDGLRRMMTLNLESAAEATRAALPFMLRQGQGRIVNIASTAGLKGYGSLSAYGAAKHALVGLTRALAIEYATTGVTVNAICPGFTDTALVQGGIDVIMQRTGRSAAEARAHFEAKNPMGRLMAPAEIGGAAAWLASPSAAGVTGQCIVIAGGEL